MNDRKYIFRVQKRRWEESDYVSMQRPWVVRYVKCFFRQRNLNV